MHYLATVLIVDDVPENLAVLHDVLDETGYQVLVSTSGAHAISVMKNLKPDLVLLDALMPEMSGFELARRIKQEADWDNIPLIFMTGLTETEHVVEAFEAGGIDYVNKPIRPKEVLARITTHLNNARLMTQTRVVMDQFGHASVSLDVQKRRVLWKTPLARRWLFEYLGGEEEKLPLTLFSWVQACLEKGSTRMPAYALTLPGRRLEFILHQASADSCLLILQEESHASVLEFITNSLMLTGKQAEVLFWVVKGKTDKDIGEILGCSPRTVNKHLENIFKKLCVENRTAAAALVTLKVPYAI